MAVSVIDVQKAYLAYFGRPADTVGLAYWMNQDAATMRAGFGASAEYATLYSGMTSEQRVEQVYQNLLGRASDPAGKAYWVGEFLAGRETVGSLVASMQTNALGVDIGTIDNRVTYSIKFTAELDTPAEVVAYSGTAAAVAARDAVSSVTYTESSLQAATSTLVTDVVSVAAGIAPSVAEATAATAAAAAAAAAVANVSLGTVTVAQANAADAATTGVVTATISDGDIATLAGLTGTGNAYTVTVTDASVAAAALNTLDGKTTVNVVATAVTTLTGAAADIITAIASAGITTVTNDSVAVTASDATITATNLNTIAADTATGAITTSNAGGWTITGLGSLTVAATGSVDKFWIAGTDTATITGFVSTSDKLDVGLLDASTTVNNNLTTGTGILTPTVNTFTLVTAGAGAADSNSAAAAAITAAAAWASTTVTTYVAVADTNSTSLYKWIDAGADECVTAELTLIGTISTVLVAGDFTFAAA